MTQGVLYKKAPTTCLRIATNDEATKYRAMKGGSEKEAVMERTRAVTQGRCQCESPSLSVQMKNVPHKYVSYLCPAAEIRMELTSSLQNKHKLKIYFCVPKLRLRVVI